MLSLSCLSFMLLLFAAHWSLRIQHSVVHVLFDVCFFVLLTQDFSCKVAVMQANVLPDENLELAVL